MKRAADPSDCDMALALVGYLVDELSSMFDGDPSRDDPSCRQSLAGRHDSSPAAALSPDPPLPGSAARA